jgi:hypothetical protein
MSAISSWGKWETIGHAWERGGCQEESDCSQSQHKSFHGVAPLRKNSHRDTLQALAALSQISSLSVPFRKS